MGSQVTVTGLGTASVSVTLASDLTAYTALNPGNRPLLLTLGVTYPAGSDIHLQRVPHQGMVCGSIQDPAAGSAGLILPVFGVSDYETSTDIPLQQRGTVTRIRVYSPNYSVGIFGVRAHLTLDNSKAVLDASANTSTFTIVRTNLDGRFSGLYVTRALDATGQERTILARAISGMTLTVSVKGLVDPASTTELIVFCHSTAQACISPAVMGVIATEEVVLMGCNLTATSPDILAAIDSRLVVFATSVSSGTSTVTGYVRGGAIRGIAGEDEGGTAGYLWVMKGTSSRFVPVECSIVVSGSAFTITVPDANLASASWFLPVSLLPSFQPDVTAIFSTLTSRIRVRPLPGASTRWSPPLIPHWLRPTERGPPRCLGFMTCSLIGSGRSPWPCPLSVGGRTRTWTIQGSVRPRTIRPPSARTTRKSPLTPLCG